MNPVFCTWSLSVLDYKQLTENSSFFQQTPLVAASGRRPGMSEFLSGQHKTPYNTAARHRTGGVPSQCPETQGFEVLGHTPKMTTESTNISYVRPQPMYALAAALRSPAHESECRPCTHIHSFYIMHRTTNPGA